jgi:hypothetical protein
MHAYNPKAPNTLADAQLNRSQFESDASKALLQKNMVLSEQKNNKTHEKENIVNEKLSYNTLPGE